MVDPAIQLILSILSLKFQPGVGVAALGTRGGFGAGFLRVEVVAADAVEGDLAALGVVERTVAPVVVGPEEAEQPQHQQAVEDDIEGVIRRRDHGRVFTRRRPGAKGKAPCF